jgi:hypothetical protein
MVVVLPDFVLCKSANHKKDLFLLATLILLTFLFNREQKYITAQCLVKIPCFYVSAWDFAYSIESQS